MVIAPVRQVTGRYQDALTIVALGTLGSAIVPLALHQLDLRGRPSATQSDLVSVSRRIAS
jgi:hypothetical protein